MSLSSVRGGVKLSWYWERLIVARLLASLSLCFCNMFQLIVLSDVGFKDLIKGKNPQHCTFLKMSWVTFKIRAEHDISLHVRES